MRTNKTNRNITFGANVVVAAGQGLVIARGTIDVPVWWNHDGGGLYRLRWDPRIIVQGLSAISANQGLYSALNAAQGAGTCRFAFITPGGVFTDSDFSFAATALDTR